VVQVLGGEGGLDESMSLRGGLEMRCIRKNGLSFHQEATRGRERLRGNLYSEREPRVGETMSPGRQV